MEIYLDYAAATPLDLRVAEEIEKYRNFFGNPSSLHQVGERAFWVLEKARARVAKVLQVKPEEIIFTSSGTESVNLAVLGVARANSKKGNHIVASAIEHPSVLRQLEREDFAVTFLPVDRHGLVNPAAVIRAIKKNTVLVSIMQANNEIGTIQPLKEIARLLQHYRKKHATPFPYLHTDAAQAAGALDIRPHDLGVNLLSLNSYKIYGPPGAGGLFVRRGVKIAPILFGG